MNHQTQFLKQKTLVSSVAEDPLTTDRDEDKLQQHLNIPPAIDKRYSHAVGLPEPIMIDKAAEEAKIIQRSKTLQRRASILDDSMT